MLSKLEEDSDRVSSGGNTDPEGGDPYKDMVFLYEGAGGDKGSSSAAAGEGHSPPSREVDARRDMAPDARRPASTRRSDSPPRRSGSAGRDRCPSRSSESRRRSHSPPRRSGKTSDPRSGVSSRTPTVSKPHQSSSRGEPTDGSARSTRASTPRVAAEASKKCLGGVVVLPVAMRARSDSSQ